MPDRQVASALATLATLLRHPALQAAGAGFTALAALVACSPSSTFTWRPRPHFTPAALANVFTVYLVGVVVTPLAGRWIPRLSARRTILLSVALSALGCC